MRISSLLLSLMLLALAAIPCKAQQFEYDNAGRLILATYADGAAIAYGYDAANNITRVQYTAPASPEPPNGVIDTPNSDVTVDAGQSVNFTGTGTDPDNATPLTFLWDFGGGAANSTAEDPGDVQFSSAGTFTVTFTVTDADGLSDSTPDTVVVTVNTPATGGGGGSDSGRSGGGGSVFLLPVLCLLVIAMRRLRRLRTLPVLLLLMSGSVHAQEWTQMDSPTTAGLNDVWMASTQLAYAVGNNGTLLRFDGAAWSAIDLGTTANLNGIWGTSASDIWIAGAAGTVFHYDGTTWSSVAAGNGAEALNLNDVWSKGPGESVWFAGARGIWEYDGATWDRKVVDAGTGGAFDPRENLTAIRGTDNYMLATASSPTEQVIFVSTPNGSGDFTRFASASAARGDLRAVWALDDTYMIASGEQTILLDGGDPTRRSTAHWLDTRAGTQVYGLWGSGRDSIWAAGGPSNLGMIRYYDGTDRFNWETVLTVSNFRFNGIHGVDASSLIAVGAVGIIYSTLGEPEEPPTPTASNFFFSFTTDSGVNTATGELTYGETDFALPAEADFYFERYYGSGLAASSGLPTPFGPDWSHTFNWSYDANAGPGQVVVTDYRGTEYLFESTPTGYNAVSPGWANVGLVDTGTEIIFYERNSSWRAIFDPATGRLTEMKDRNGNALSMNYTGNNLTSVSDSVGSIVDISYGANNQVNAVSVVRDTTISRTYAYDGSNRLVATTSPRNATTVYGYDANGRFQQATHAAGTPDETTRYSYQYDGERVSASTLNGGGTTRYSYDTANRQTTVTQPDGGVRTYGYDSAYRLTRSQSAERVVELHTYDALGRRDSYTDGDGRTTRYTYDPVSGRTRSLVEPGGFTTFYSYRSRNLPDGVTFHDIEVIDHPDGGTTWFRYDANGNLIQIEDPEGNFTDFTYDAAGNILTRQFGAGGVHAYTWNSRRQLVSETDPDGYVTSYEYDSFGRTIERTDAAGTTTATFNSDRDVPDRVQLPSGAVWDYGYDQLGRRVQDQRSDNFRISRTYDDAGNIEVLGLGDSLAVRLAVSYTYDPAGRVRDLRLNDALQWTRNYDLDSRPVAINDGPGRQWQLEYDGSHAITAVVRPDGQRTDVDRTTDPRGLPARVTRGTKFVDYMYDAMGRVLRTSDSEGREMERTRDLNGSVLNVEVLPSGVQQSYAYDSFGNIDYLIDALGGVSRRNYGDDGLLDTETDPAGNTHTFTRDANNRRTTIAYDDGLECATTYGSNYIVSNTTCTDGTTKDVTSTPEGLITGGTNVTASVRPDGKLTAVNGMQVVYDALDRVEQIVYPDNFSVTYQYNENNETTGIFDTAGNTTLLTRGDLGEVLSITTPGGDTTSFTYDSELKLTGIDVSGLGSMSRTLDANGRPRSQTSTLPIMFTVPDLSRDRTYDQASQDTGANYDARGNQVSDGTITREWDALNRVTSVDAGSGVATYEYDAWDNIVSEAVDGEMRYYVQNYLFGRPVISEVQDEAGSTLWKYIHDLDGRPVYRINSSNEVQTFVFDFDGNMAMIRDVDGNILASYAYSPHGDLIHRDETVDNSFTVAAQYGAFEMADKKTISVGGRYFNSESGHFLDRNDFEVRASLRWQLGGAPKGSGRSVSPGDIGRHEQELLVASSEAFARIRQEKELRRINPLWSSPDAERLIQETADAGDFSFFLDEIMADYTESWQMGVLARAGYPNRYPNPNASAPTGEPVRGKGYQDIDCAPYSSLDWIQDSDSARSWIDIYESLQLDAFAYFTRWESERRAEEMERRKAAACNPASESNSVESVLKSLPQALVLL